MKSRSHTLNIPVISYVSTLSAIALVLLGTHLGLYLYHYLRDELPWLLLQLFDLDEENNLPTWFSSFLLLNNAAFLWLASRQSGVKKPGSWSLLAIGFLILAIDEVAGLHETFHTMIDINWAIPGGILVAIVACFFVPFLVSLPRKLALLFILSGGIFVSGAILAELLSEDLDVESIEYACAVFVEEGLEMSGALLFLFVNMRRLAKEGILPVETVLEME
jgi:hypothetical protein